MLSHPSRSLPKKSQPRLHHYKKPARVSWQKCPHFEERARFQLVDEPRRTKTHFEPEPEPEQEGVGEEYDMECAIQMSLELFQPQVHAHVRGVAIQEPVAEAIQPLPVLEGKATEEVSTRQSAQPQDDTSANIVRDSTSPTDAKTRAELDKTNSGGDTEILQISEELGEDVTNQVKLEEKTAELDQDQAGSDPGESLESRPQPEQVHMDEDQAGPDPGISRVALAGPDLEPTHDEFIADLYLKVQESLKFLADEHVILEDPLSSNVTLSSMKNLEDAYAIGDQFINDISTDDESRKLNVEAEVVSMVTILIYQASSSVPPLTTESELTDRITALEKKLSDLEQNNKNLDNMTWNLRSRVDTLELMDLPYKINEAVRENVKEAVQIALQAPLRDRFKDLSEEDMKEMLHQRMFETGSYKSSIRALYEALEASMERAQRDEFLAEKDKSHKLRRDDQDHPPPPPDSDLSKRRQHNTGASGSSLPQAPQSSAWKKFDTQDAPSSSTKQQSGPYAKQPVKNIPIPDSANISDSEDTDSAHLPKIKQSLEWLKPIPDDERPPLKPAYSRQRTLLEKINGKVSQDATCSYLLANPEGDQVRIDISKPLPLSGPPGHVTIQTQFFFNKDLDYLRYGSKGSGQSLSISKMKAARYQDFGLEILVPEHMWINDVCTYDINSTLTDTQLNYSYLSICGISHWWFNHQKFYIDRHTAESSHKVVRTHMRILSVVRIKAYSWYGYDYLKVITLRRADH
ncbi:hypothetical protein Tco_1124779 [Tanacetum coccineum]|uniref:Uncharacterized protein n=1 Tax=Tanacetum coccineum TaxID=301880 RepID=A0ABQ5J755_9ASTR